MPLNRHNLRHFHYDNTHLIYVIYRQFCRKSDLGDKFVDVDLIFKIAAIGIIVAVLNQVLIRSGREEQAMMVTLAGIVVVLMMLVRQISSLFETVKSVFGL